MAGRLNPEPPGLQAHHVTDQRYLVAHPPAARRAQPHRVALARPRRVEHPKVPHATRANLRDERDRQLPLRADGQMLKLGRDARRHAAPG